MIQRRSTFFLGIFIFLIPFTGFPTSWKTSFIIFSGLALIALSVKIVLPNKHLVKPKLKTKKSKIVPIFTQDISTHPQDNTIEKAESNINSEGNSDIN